MLPPTLASVEDYTTTRISVPSSESFRRTESLELFVVAEAGASAEPPGKSSRLGSRSRFPGRTGELRVALMACNSYGEARQTTYKLISTCGEQQGETMQPPWWTDSAQSCTWPRKRRDAGRSVESLRSAWAKGKHLMPAHAREIVTSRNPVRVQESLPGLMTRPLLETAAGTTRAVG